ncbi:hypothetical protein N7532_005253 [Penicillium argentinense]|uniref:Rhodopsin domain-containing protein n=1 Tax=Penicillium argentinense TaxID=1131581 RepID=A0A9W9KAR4_9EURO|nr:uncharacterized protein N7532_005253 [Penicillium argentinense]KAJ5098252.1 hypothetical protein N7532_005253 [Penicillium argentinense]
MPIPVLSNLQLPQKKKAGLILIFAAGSFACITSIVRLRIVATDTKATDSAKPIANAELAKWSFVEMNMGIICSCLPSLYPIFTRIFPSLLSPNRQCCCDRMAPLNRRPTAFTTGQHGQVSFHSGIVVTQEVDVETPECAFMRGS